MKKLFLSLFLIAGFAFWTLHQKKLSDTAALSTVGMPVATVSTTLPSQTPVSTPSTAKQPPPKATTPPATTTPTPTPTPAPKTTPTSTGAFRDGQYTGLVADAYYGNVQVKAVITNGKLTDVKFLQYPNDRSTSVFINSQALPYLRQEAIQAQSAKVNTISGATDTSGAFRKSLADALTQAKA
ncbi:MAG TPA: FMN-binding protein [Candidatus Paceibacterota bacterium]|nr:FMN-binding protein [Candidatus Paceibacterota bacterium]